MSSIRTKSRSHGRSIGRVLFPPLLRVTGFLGVPRGPASNDGLSSLAISSYPRRRYRLVEIARRCVHLRAVLASIYRRASVVLSPLGLGGNE